MIYNGIEYDIEIENYGQWLDLEKPKVKSKYILLCHCPKCGKKHIRSYLDLEHSKENIYCKQHKRERMFEAKYGKGITNPQKIPGVADKTKATKAKKYGDDWGQKWYEEQKKRVMALMGVENSAFVPDHMLKSYESMVRRYGSVEKGWRIRQKHIEETAEKNYGSYETYTKKRIDAIINSMRETYGDPTIRCMSDIPELKEKRFEKYLEDIQYFDNIKILFKNGDYVFKCLDCGYEMPIYYENRVYRCPKCNQAVKPKGLIMSITSFITRLGLTVENDKFEPDVGLNFDIYIPSKKVAIDAISTSTHSNLDMNYLKDREEVCSQKGIQLISLFEDFWYEKPEAVKANIKTILDCNDNVINGLDGYVTEITVSEYEDFCEENHICGMAAASLKLGLRFNGILVSVLGLRIPTYKKEYTWEIARTCCKKNYTVENALHAFMIWMTKNHSGDSIIYYHDKRWPLDIHNAMEELGDSSPSVHFWKGDGKLQPWTFCLKSRGQCTNIDFESDLSVIKNLLKNGYNTIYDCGFKLLIYQC